MTSHPSREVQLHISPTPEASSRAAADTFAGMAIAAAAGGRTFTVALTGGSSPVRLYHLLASDPYRLWIPWEAVHVFWGDERCVPPAHPRSNFGLANRLLLSHIHLPPENIHRIRGELPPAEAASRYGQELEDFFGRSVPRFSLVHLGMGSDGHVASLFPFDPLLFESERTTAISLRHPEGEWRVTLTYPALNSAKRIEFLVFGAEKQERVHDVLRGARDPMRIPAQGIRPVDGTVVWRLDRGAASRLAESGSTPE